MTIKQNLKISAMFIPAFNAYLKYFIKYFTMAFWYKADKKDTKKKKQTNIYDLRDLSECDFVWVSFFFLSRFPPKLNAEPRMR